MEQENITEQTEINLICPLVSFGIVFIEPEDIEFPNELNEAADL